MGGPWSWSVRRLFCRVGFGRAVRAGGRQFNVPLARRRGGTRGGELLWSGSEGVFADDAADPGAAMDAKGVEVSDRCREGLQRRGLAEGAVRPVLVVMGLVLTKDLQQVDLVPDQRLVEQFTSAAADPALHDRVCAGCSDGAAQDPDAGVAKHGVDGGGELGVAIAEQELD